MPSDDESDDDAPGFGAPLPPDDRLWRHPSELGPAGDAAGGGATGGSTGTATAKRSGPNLWGVAVVAGLVGAALSLGVVVTMGGLRDHVVEKPVVEKVPVRAMAEYASSTPNPVVGVTRTIGPAVARLDVATATGATAGSGVLFRDDGYLVTDAHLVQQAKTVQVTLADGRSAPGTILGVDKWTSVAVVKIDTGQVPVATFGSATDLQLGESAIAIGAPIGTSGGPSVTAGVVSALGKKVDSIEGADLHDMIETDAASASTSPGGALANADGVVVGLLTTATPADSPAGMGFAAPIDVVRAVAEDIIATGAAHHAWFGVEGADTDGGARVTKVVDGSPAATAGLSADDVIAAVDGTKITSMSALSVELHGHHSGDTITLVVARAGQDLTMTATLAERTPS